MEDAESIGSSRSPASVGPGRCAGRANRFRQLQSSCNRIAERIPFKVEVRLPVNTHPMVTSRRARVANVLALSACLTLAACGGSPDWKDAKPYVTVGGKATGITGTVVLNLKGIDGETLSLTQSGPFSFPLAIPISTGYQAVVVSAPAGTNCVLTNDTGTTLGPDVTSIGVACTTSYPIGGTVSGATGSVVLQNNGGDNHTVNGNGSFVFATPVQAGLTYSVTVLSSPIGQACTVANGASTANSPVTDVAVTCATLPFTLRPLPAVYSTGKAINYSAYRAGGPAANEFPTVAQITQDLDLLHAAGYDLLRLFGSDQTSDRILSTALALHPEMKFHLGIYLEGPTTAPACDDPVNNAQIAAAVIQANQYTNVATVSVGNETSLAHNQPIACLATYVSKVRAQVKQPITADDDWSFYAGKTGASYLPDTVLSQIDFVSIHMYPFSDTGPASCSATPPDCGIWNTWTQTALAAGPLRAAAMMNSALAFAKSQFTAVSNYMPAGSTMTIGASRPIVIGETGWKATPTNPSQAIEAVQAPAIASQVNAKWYFDLLYGNPLNQAPVLPIAAWQGSAQGPLAIFDFEAFDENWKGTDDGWGLWDASRAPRYVLCGTSVPGAPTCHAGDLYNGAGYYH